MQPKVTQILDRSAAVLLLAVATALLIGSRIHADMIVPHEPIFGISIRYVFWALAGIAFVAALLILVNEESDWPAIFTAWIATDFAAYLVGLYFQTNHGLTGFLGGISHAFEISPTAANVIALLTTFCLLAAGYGSICSRWLSRKRDENFLKTFCLSCGGHMKFVKADLGQKVPCPHCRNMVTLRKSENLKISCYFCKEHIEFPAHALGQKISCPHCKMDITLKESA